MRAQAEDYLKQMMKELHAAEMSASRGSGNSYRSMSMGMSSSVKQKLVNAISVMQQGLVERDTEVRAVSSKLLSSIHQVNLQASSQNLVRQASQKLAADCS